MATLNRDVTLQRVLEAYCLLDQVECPWQLIIVDNGSNDKTGQVVSSFQERLPIVYVAEPRQGKTHALNSGMRYADGDLIIFVDDDGIPCGSWLRDYFHAASEQPEFDIFGGPVRALWPEAGPPLWAISDQTIVHTCFGTTDEHLPTGPVDELALSGANLGIRRQALPEGVVHDPGIGPRGTKYPMGSEADLLRKVAAQGSRAWFVRNAIVEHIIRKDQITASWLFRRAHNSGRGICKLWYPVDEPSLWGIPHSYFRSVIRSGAAWLRVAATRGLESALPYRWYFHRALGSFQQARRQFFELSRIQKHSMALCIIAGGMAHASMICAHQYISDFISQGLLNLA